MENPLKAVPLDLRLPKVDGLELQRQVRGDEMAEACPRRPPVLRRGHDIVESYRLGANGYVSKPVEFHEFSDVVTKLGLYWLLVNKPPY